MTKFYHNGPIESTYAQFYCFYFIDYKRDNTDLPCLVIFVALNLAMLMVALYACIGNGFEKLTTPYDPDGKGCGVDPTYEQYPYIYFASPHPDSLHVTVCVKSCPSGSALQTTSNDNLQLQCHPNTLVDQCTYRNSADNTRAIQIYSTFPVNGNICMPNEYKIQSEVFLALGIETIHQQILATLRNSWVVIAFSIPLAVVLAVVVMFIMRLTAGYFVYVGIGCGVGLSLGLGLVLIIIGLIGMGGNEGDNSYNDANNSPDGLMMNSVTTSKIFSLFSGNNYYLSVVAGVLCILLSFSLAILSYCFRRRIQLASNIIKVSTRFVHQNFPVILLQGALFCAILLFVFVWMCQAMTIYSLGQPSFNSFNENNDKSLPLPPHQPFQHYTPTLAVNILSIIHVFYLAWGVLFLLHTSQFLVSGTAASWYYSQQQQIPQQQQQSDAINNNINRESRSLSSLPTSDPSAQSIQRYYIHIGSICMGSGLTTAIGFFKLLHQIFNPGQNDSYNDGGCLKAYRRCCNCCCCFCTNWLFGMLSSGTYAFMHLSGDCYCKSAFEVLAVKVRDPIITGVISMLELGFQVLIRVGITLGVGMTCYVILKNLQPYKQNSDLLMTPSMICIGVLSFVIASLFVEVYAQAMQAISVCYLVDKDSGEQKSEEEEGDQNKDRQNKKKMKNNKNNRYPNQLREFLHQANKIDKNDEASAANAQKSKKVLKNNNQRSYQQQTKKRQQQNKRR